MLKIGLYLTHSVAKERLSFRAWCLIYLPAHLTQNLFISSTYFTYVFGMILKIKSRYFVYKSNKILFLMKAFFGVRNKSFYVVQINRSRQRAEINNITYTSLKIFKKEIEIYYIIFVLSKV
jgi:hypothetical protein